MRFGSQNRLRLARDIALVRGKSAKTDCAAFVFYCLPKPGAQHSRIAIVASKRIGGAVVRNRARRVFREIFRACAPNFKLPCDIMVFVRKNYAASDFRSLSDKFAAAADKSLSSFLKQCSEDALGHE